MSFDSFSDPVPDMHLFIYRASVQGHQGFSAETDEYDIYSVDCWDINNKLVHLRLLHHDMCNDDFEQHFFVNPDNLFKQFRKAYCTFGKGDGLWWPEEKEEDCEDTE